MFIQGYTFDDVLLIPKHSSVNSRSDVDISITLPKNVTLQIPLISANMKTVTNSNLALEISKLGGLAILHRFDDYLNILNDFKSLIKTESNIGVSIGIKNKDLQFAKSLYSNGCRIICVDIAHGDHSNVVDFIKQLRFNCNDLLIIAGNVATPHGSELLWNAGADIIKVGVGPGSLCTTRIETGNGYPQLSALKNVFEHHYKEKDGHYPMFIADGGIKSSGDCVKALVFSHAVMIGNLFAGTDEAPGKIISLDEKKYKIYAGSSTHKQKHIEGVIGLVPYKGSIKNIVNKLIEGIKSGCSYQGVSNLEDLKLSPEFVVISNSGLTESKPHNVRI